jgi:hypothetical protein
VNGKGIPPIPPGGLFPGLVDPLELEDLELEELLDEAEAELLELEELLADLEDELLDP